MVCKPMYRELIQLAVSVKRYISSPENGVEMLMISLVLWILTQNTEENVSLYRNCFHVYKCLLKTICVNRPTFE